MIIATMTEPRWTLETYVAHMAEMRRADERLQAERDRRLAEVAFEKEKALYIQKETQQYKDEKANALRDQIGSERGLYATKDDLQNSIREMVATIKPALEFMSQQQGGDAAITDFRTAVLAVVAIIVAILVGHPFG